MFSLYKFPFTSFKAQRLCSCEYSMQSSPTHITYMVRVNEISAGSPMHKDSRIWPLAS